jgi:hypothetical protein
MADNNPQATITANQAAVDNGTAVDSQGNPITGFGVPNKAPAAPAATAPVNPASTAASAASPVAVVSANPAANFVTNKIQPTLTQAQNDYYKITGSTLNAFLMPIS